MRTFGPATVENFNKLGIKTSHVKHVKGASSGVAPIFVEPRGQSRILMVKGTHDLSQPADVVAPADLLKTVDCMVMQFEIPIETTYQCIARKLGRAAS